MIPTLRTRCASWRVLSSVQARLAGCDSLQSLEISRPIPALDIVEWMRAHESTSGGDQSGDAEEHQHSTRAGDQGRQQ